MNGDVYLVEKGYFGLGKNNKDKVVLKIYTVRKSKECMDRGGSRKRKSVERIARINLEKLNWK